MPPANIPVIAALRYQRIDIWVRDTADQPVPFELYHRISTRLLELIEADTAACPPLDGMEAPTVFHSTYGPVEGYMLQVCFMGHSPVLNYPTLRLMVYCVPVDRKPTDGSRGDQGRHACVPEAWIWKSHASI